MKTFAMSIALLMVASFAFAQEPAAKTVVVKEQNSVANVAVQDQDPKAETVVEPQAEGGTVAPAVSGGNGCCNPDPCCRRGRRVRRVWSRLGSRRCCR